MTRTLLALCLVAACGNNATESAKTDDKPPAAARPGAADPDATCAAKVKSFQSWLTLFELEQRSYETDFGSKMVVIDRAPMPVSHQVDNVTILNTSIEAFDVSQHDHSGGKPGE